MSFCLDLVRRWIIHSQASYIRVTSLLIITTKLSSLPTHANSLEPHQPPVALDAHLDVSIPHHISTTAPPNISTSSTARTVQQLPSVRYAIHHTYSEHFGKATRSSATRSMELISSSWQLLRFHHGALVACHAWKCQWSPRSRTGLDSPAKDQDSQQSGTSDFHSFVSALIA